MVLGGDLVKSTEHIGVSYIAAYLRERQIEANIYEVKDIENSQIYEQLEQYDIVGFTSTCVTLANELKVAQKLKQRAPNILTVFGGHMATFGGKEIMASYLEVDFIIFGEGEITFYELIKAINSSNYSEINGLMYRNTNGSVIKNPDRELIANLDDLPFPIRDQFIARYKRTHHIRVSTSRGCYGNCAFCSSFVGRKQKGPRWRGRSPQNVVDELEHLVKTYKFHTFDFVDSTFEDPGAFGKKRIAEIANLIIERKLNIYYNCCLRAENWSEEDNSLIELLIESGLEKVNIGFEAGNDRGLEILQKNATMADNLRVLEVLGKYPEVYITFGFIMLHPYSAKQDLWDNAKFLYETSIGHVIRHYFWQLEVYPGTSMEKRLIKDRLLKKDYEIADGMYKYKFLHHEMEFFSEAFHKFVGVQSIWDFEIFDIVIHTFINRLRRKYKNNDFYQSIEQFEKFVLNERAAMAKFNYDFFLKLYNSEAAYPIEAEIQRLDSYIREKMALIKSEQFKLGRQILRLGEKLVSR